MVPCISLKILRERSHIGSNPITRTISTPQVGGSWQSEILSGCYFHVFGTPQTQSQTLFRRLYGSSAQFPSVKERQPIDKVC